MAEPFFTVGWLATATDQWASSHGGSHVGLRPTRRFDWRGGGQDRRERAAAGGTAAHRAVGARRPSPNGGHQKSLRVEEAHLTVAPPANGRRSDEINGDRRRPAVCYDDGDELGQGRGGEDVPEDGVLTLDA